MASLFLALLVSFAAGALEEIVLPPELNDAAASVRDGIRVAYEALQRESHLPALQRAERYGRFGMLLHAHDYVEPALQAYENARELAPGDPRWPYLIATLEHFRGNFDDAIKQARAALALGEDNHPVRLRLAQWLLETNRLEGMVAELDLLPQSEQDGSVALSLRGRAALARRDYAKARDYLEAALRAAPGANALHYQLAQAYRGLGDLDRARRHLERRGEVSPQLFDPLLAEIQRMSLSAMHYLTMGLAALEQQRAEIAEQAFRRAIDLDPALPEAQLNLALLLNRSGKPNEAIEQMETLLARSPGHAGAYFNLGLSHEILGDLAKAREMYETALSQDPDLLQVHLALADNLMRAQAWPAAAEAYQAVIDLDGELMDARVRQAAALVAADRCEDATDRIEAAYRARRNQGELINALARLRATCAATDLQDREHALRLARLLYRAAPTLEITETLAMAEAANGNFEDAEAYQTQAMFLALRAGAAQPPEGLQHNLARYRAGQPASTPWAAHNPALSPPEVIQRNE